MGRDKATLLRWSNHAAQKRTSDTPSATGWDRLVNLRWGLFNSHGAALALVSLKDVWCVMGVDFHPTRHGFAEKILQKYFNCNFSMLFWHSYRQ
jgi:hypothetical protein